MTKNRWVTFVVIAGGVLLLVQQQNYTKKIGFKLGVECILKGGERGMESTPKICKDFYIENEKDLLKRIESIPDTKTGKTEKRIWARHLIDFAYLRKNGLTKTFFQTGLQ